MKVSLKKVFGIIGILFVVAMASLFMYVSLTLPDISGYSYSPKLKTEIKTTTGKLVGEVYDENRTMVSVKEMPDNLKNALVAIEDRRFYKHHGFDPKGIFRAVVVNVISGGKSQGASTITQQVTRRLFLSDERTYTRKIKEILLSIKFEQHMSKNQILEIYLNDVFLGEGTYGVQEAATRFFSKDVKDLTLEECAMIAGMPQAPSVYNPVTKEGYKQCMERKNEVLEAMESCGFITEEQCAKAEKKKIAISKSDEKKGFNGRNKKGCGAYVQRVISETEDVLVDKFTANGQMTEKAAKNKVEQMINQDGLQITCSMNMTLQKAAYKASKDTLSAYGKTDSADIAFVTIDGTNGKVLTYYGGKSAIDMANTARQPGSTIKPLYVSKYLEREDKTPYSSISAAPLNLFGYNVKNDGGQKIKGSVSVQQAIARSLNTANVRIFDELGYAENGNLAGYEAVKDFGFSSLVDPKDNKYYNDCNYALGTGGLTYGLKPIELCNAYSAFANGGKKNEYYFVEKITTNSGKVLYEKKASKATRVRTVEGTNEIIECMKASVRGGTSSPASNEYITFGKTGTTSSNKALWWCGCTGNLATTIWVGSPKNYSIYGMSSGGVASFYRRFVNNTESIKNGYFGKVAGYANNSHANTKNGEEPKKVKLLVVKDEIDIENREYFTRLEVTTIAVPEDEVENYEDRLVEKATVDATSGDLFNDEKCDIKDKDVRYYIKGKAPSSTCNKMHMF